VDVERQNPKVSDRIFISRCEIAFLLMASFQSKVCEPKPHSGTRFQCASIDKSPAPLCFGKRTSRTPIPVDRRSKSGGLSRYETRRLRDKEAELTQKLQLRVQKNR
jgi:hypothetical protein